MSAKPDKKSCKHCKICVNCSGRQYPDFQKVVELKDLGLTLYHYDRPFLRSPNAGEPETKTIDSNNIFILLNTSYEEASTGDCLSALESTRIPCLRCRQIAQRAQKLLQPGENIGGKGLKGICEHCSTQARQEHRQSCFECLDIVKKFAAAIDVKSAFRTALGPSVERRHKEDKKMRSEEYINILSEVAKSYLPKKDTKILPEEYIKILSEVAKNILPKEDKQIQAEEYIMIISEVAKQILSEEDKKMPFQIDEKIRSEEYIKILSEEAKKILPEDDKNIQPEEYVKVVTKVAKRILLEGEKRIHPQEYTKIISKVAKNIISEEDKKIQPEDYIKILSAVAKNVLPKEDKTIQPEQYIKIITEVANSILPKKDKMIHPQEYTKIISKVAKNIISEEDKKIRPEDYIKILSAVAKNVQPKEDKTIQPEQYVKILTEVANSILPKEDNMTQPQEYIKIISKVAKNIISEEDKKIRPEKYIKILSEVAKNVLPKENKKIQPEEYIKIITEVANSILPKEDRIIQPQEYIKITSKVAKNIISEEDKMMRPEEYIKILSELAKNVAKNTKEDKKIQPEEYIKILSELAKNVLTKEDKKIQPEEYIKIITEVANSILPKEDKKIQPQEYINILSKVAKNIISEEDKKIRPEEYIKILSEVATNVLPKEDKKIQPEEYIKILSEVAKNVLPKEDKKIRPEEYRKILSEVVKNILPDENEKIRPEKFLKFLSELTKNILPGEDKNIRPEEYIKNLSDVTKNIQPEGDKKVQSLKDTKIRSEEYIKILSEVAKNNLPKEIKIVQPEQYIKVLNEVATEILPEEYKKIRPQEFVKILSKVAKNIISEEDKMIRPEEYIKILSEVAKNILPEEDNIKTRPEEYIKILSEVAKNILPEKDKKFRPAEYIKVLSEVAKNILPEEDKKIRPEECIKILSEVAKNILSDKSKNIQSEENVKKIVSEVAKNILSKEDKKIRSAKNKKILSEKDKQITESESLGKKLLLFATSSELITDVKEHENEEEDKDIHIEGKVKPTGDFKDEVTAEQKSGREYKEEIEKTQDVINVSTKLKDRQKGKKDKGSKKEGKITEGKLEEEEDQDIGAKSKQHRTKRELNAEVHFQPTGDFKDEITAEQKSDREHKEKIEKTQDVINVSTKLKDRQKGKKDKGSKKEGKITEGKLEEEEDQDIGAKSKQHRTKRELNAEVHFQPTGDFKDEITAEQKSDREHKEKIEKTQDVINVSTKIKDLQKGKKDKRSKKDKDAKIKEENLAKPEAENMDNILNKLNKVLLKQDKNQKKAMKMNEKLKKKEKDFRKRAEKKAAETLGSFELPKITFKQEISKATIVNQATEPGEQYLQLPIKKIKLKAPSADNLILKLVKIRQSKFNKKYREEGATKVLESIIAKKIQKRKYRDSETGSVHQDSDYLLDIDSFLEGKREENRDIIVGNEILNPTEAARYWATKDKESGQLPSIFKTKFDEPPLEEPVQVAKTVNETPNKRSKAKTLMPQPSELSASSTGVIRYKLSDKSFIDMGWTSIPTQKTFRKMNLYRMRPARPEFDWFKHNSKKGYLLYDTGELLATFDDTGHGRWYYKNGELALDFYDAEELNAKQRIVIYSTGETDSGRPRPVTVLGSFDYNGNGIVLDHSGHERLKYNQTEGIILDKTIGPKSHWKWHNLNDPPQYQQLWIEEQEKHADPRIQKLIQENEKNDKTSSKKNEDGGEDGDIDVEIRKKYVKDMLAVQKKLAKNREFKPFKIRMKAVKMNDYFSLRVLDQSNIYILFRDGLINLKLNVGMNLDPFEIIDMEYLEVQPNFESHLNKFPAISKSIEDMQSNISIAKKTAARYRRYERKVHPTVPKDPAEQVAKKYLSRPLTSPLLTTTFSKCNCVYSADFDATLNIF